jgi:hypothetical protein
MIFDFIPYSFYAVCDWCVTSYRFAFDGFPIAVESTTNSWVLCSQQTSNEPYPARYPVGFT